MPSNLYLLENAAGKLGKLLDEVVFVGGSTLDLIVSIRRIKKIEIPKIVGDTCRDTSFRIPVPLRARLCNDLCL